MCRKLQQEIFFDNSEHNDSKRSSVMVKFSLSPVGPIANLEKTLSTLALVTGKRKCLRYCSAVIFL
jgi:hypothetical protein